jgi:hypothetical protein
MDFYQSSFGKFYHTGPILSKVGASGCSRTGDASGEFLTGYTHLEVDFGCLRRGAQP